MTRCRKAAGYVRTGLAICGGLYITVLAVAFWLTAPRTARSGCNPPYDVEDCCECDEVKIELEQNTLCLGASATGVVHWTYRGEIGVVPPRHISVSPTSRLLLSDVVHHPSERCTDTNIISTFTITAVGFSSALNDAEVIAWTRECFNTNPVSVIGVDLDLDSDHTHDYDGWPTGGEPTVFEDAIEDGSGAATNYPGLKFIVVNDFHETDAGTGVPGYADFEMTSPYAPADSSVFVELQLALAPALMAMTGATVEFTYHASDPSGVTTTNQDGVVIYNLPTTTNSHLRLWTQKQSTDRNTNSVPSGHFIASGEPYSAADLGFSATATKRIFFIEAVSNAAELAKCAIRVAVAYEDDLVCDDTVICTPIRVDVDVDSNNDDGFAVPERNLAEDHYEDLTNGYFAVGKVIEVNSEEETSDEQFVPIVFEIPEPIDIDQADVRLEYQAADTAAGRLGIWKRVAGRTAADYVAPSNYTATAFGFSADQRIVTNYIQAITVSAAPGDARVVFSVDPDGAATSVPGYIAVDAVRVTSIKVDLVPDYNRDGVIDQDDKDEQSVGNPYRFWVNDDNDSGYDGGNDIPGSPGLGERDWEKHGLIGFQKYTVDGVRDFADFFPLWLDIKDALAVYPAASFSYVLKHSEGHFNALINTGLTSSEAGYHLRNKDFSESHDDAELEHIDVDGYELPLDFLNGITGANKALILLESRGSTEAPLVLEIVDSAGALVSRKEMPVKTSGVEQMFRHKNFIKVADTTSTPIQVPDRATASNYPDSLCSSKWLIFLAGVNVDEQSSRGWQSTMFKSFYWSGSNAKFVGITYYAAEGSSANYQHNVTHAFQTASNVAEYVNNALTGTASDKIVVAHSMGNILVSSAISDHNMLVAKYLMVDPAVALECYDGTTFNESSTGNEMLNPDWREYGSNTWASTWHKLFPVGDDRRRLSWRNRFTNAVPVAFNFYSSEDQVFDINTGVLSMFSGVEWAWSLPFVFGVDRYSWHKQEFFKGRKYGILNIGATEWAGWGFRETSSGARIYSADEANSASDLQLRTVSVFRNSPLTMFSSSITLEDQNNILAKGIPALSHCAGRNDIGTIPVSRNTDVSTLKDNGWPRNHPTYGEWWLHNDIREMAYLYIYKAFDEMVTKGELQ
jgi:hypothetical protein